MTHDETLTDEQRWAIAMAKDRRFDGCFVTGVLLPVDGGQGARIG